MRGLNVHITEDGQLGFEVDFLAEYLRAGLTTGPSGAHVAQAAKLQLHRGMRPIEQGLIVLADVPKFQVTLTQQDLQEADTRSRYQKYMDRRKAQRLERAMRQAELEAENRQAEAEALNRGLHDDFLTQQAKQEAEAAEWVKRHPELQTEDLDLHQWLQEGEPVDVPTTVPAAPSRRDDEEEVLDE